MSGVFYMLPVRPGKPVPLGRGLFRAFFAVVAAAEHLAVVRRCGASLAPRRDVVRLHFVQFVVLAFAAPGTDALLVIYCYVRE